MGECPQVAPPQVRSLWRHSGASCGARECVSACVLCVCVIARWRVTCNNASVPDGLRIGLLVAVVIATLLAGEVLVLAWLLVRRRLGLGWLVALAMALAGAALSVWDVTDI